MMTGTSTNSRILLCLATLLAAVEFACNQAQAPDPDINLDARGLITTKGYPLEEYTVETTDGYLLSMHRIPRGIHAPGHQRGVFKPAVYLQHGLMGSSENWIMNMADQSLAFILADAGYDVWMGNCRGTIYSRRHKTLSPSSTEFWQFSFHEMAMFDMPAMADFVATKTGQEQIYYVGHSQGGMIGLIKFSQDPVWAARRIRQFHAMAPACYFDHITSYPLKVLAPLTGTIAAGWRATGFKEFSGKSEMAKLVSAQVCSSYIGVVRQMCETPLMLITVMDTKYMNMTRMPVFLAHGNGGTSSQNIAHFGQMVSTKQFRSYDYGYLANGLKADNGKHPIVRYDLSTFAVPTVLYTGGADSVVSPGDMERLTREIGAHISHHYIFPDTVHLDFIWGLNGQSQIYPLFMKELQADRTALGAPAGPNAPAPGPAQQQAGTIQQLVQGKPQFFPLAARAPQGPQTGYAVPTTVVPPQPLHPQQQSGQATAQPSVPGGAVQHIWSPVTGGLLNTFG